MKAPAFSYARPATLNDALALLAQHGDLAKILSGGQSLLPALNLRLSAPDWLIDIGAISELRGIAVDGPVLRIGATVRHADILTSPVIAEHAPLLAQAMVHVAHPAIRNRGTLGGNLAHADPASEMPACMLALDATMILVSAVQERRIPAIEFFTGIYETALAPNELLVAIEIPLAPSAPVVFFREYSRRMGDYAIVGLAALGQVDGDRFSDLRLGYFAVGDRPVLAAAARHLIGDSVSEAMLGAALAALDAELDPLDDQQATAGMRKHLARQLLTGCVAQMLGRPDFESRKIA